MKEGIKMAKVKIIADSTCDLSQELLEKYQVDIIPLNIVMGEESYLDGSEITPDEIYAWADKEKSTPKTAAVGMEQAMKILKPYDKEGGEIIFIGISEEMSTTCNVIRLVSEEMEHAKVSVIDSKNLSTGIGLLVIEAAQMAEDGKSAEEIVAAIEILREKVRASFVVDTLTYLHRGGRCSAVTALVAGALKLKPEIVVKDGKMDVAKKYRGKIQSVIKNYVEDLTEEIRHAKPDRVFITHSGCDTETVEMVRNLLREEGRFAEILETRAGGVISSHCGPNTLGVLFIEE